MWNNIAYNVLPLACLAYFIWLAVLRVGRGEMLDISFLLTFLLFLGAICVLQHVLAERGFRRRGNRFIRTLENDVEELVQNTMAEKALPKIRAFSESLSNKVDDFVSVKKLIR
jgi:hypothetical protein